MYSFRCYRRDDQSLLSVARCASDNKEDSFSSSLSCALGAPVDRCQPYPENKLTNNNIAKQVIHIGWHTPMTTPFKTLAMCSVHLSNVSTNGSDKLY